MLGGSKTLAWGFAMAPVQLRILVFSAVHGKIEFTHVSLNPIQILDGNNNSHLWQEPNISNE